MGFYREFEDLFLQQADRISFDLNNKSFIGYRANMRNEENIRKSDHSLDGEVCGIIAGAFADAYTLFLLPIGLYAYQKIKKANPRI